MAHVEIHRNGTLISLSEVPTTPSAGGAYEVRLESGAVVTVSAGQTIRAEGCEVTVRAGPPAGDAAGLSLAATRAAAAGGPPATLGAAETMQAGVVAPPDAAESRGPRPRVAGYELLDRLGAGGMGVVWRARHLASNRQVALKLLPAGRFSSPKARARFDREIELATRLTHPNVARVYGVEQRGGVYAYAMELVPGLPLDRYVAEHALSQRQVLVLLRDVCRGVQHAHMRGVVHRDLKPANILVAAGGQAGPDSPPRPFVVDFGLARTLLEEDAGVTISVDGEVAGTPAFMSPEQAAGHLGELDTRSDVYSLGVILYQLLTGSHPHGHAPDMLEMMRRIIEEDPRRPRSACPHLARDLEAMLLKAMDRDPARRYANAGELADDLDRYLGGLPLTARRASTGYYLGKFVRRNRLLVAMVMLAVIGVVGLAVGSYVQIALDTSHARGDRSRAEESLRQERQAQAALLADRPRLLSARQDAQQASARAEAEAKNAREALDAYRKEAARAERAEQSAQRVFYANTVLRAGAEIAAGSPAAAGELLQAAPKALRGWEWQYLRRLAEPDPRVLHGHTAGVSAVAFSRDGKLLASAGREQTVRVWETATGRLVHELKAGELPAKVDLKVEGRGAWRITGLAFDPAGRQLRAVTPAGDILAWNIGQGEPVARQVFQATGLDGRKRIRPALSPSGDYVACLLGAKEDSRYRSHQIALYYGTKELWSQDIPLDPDYTAGPAFTPDGRTVAVGTLQGLYLIDAETGKIAFSDRGESWPNYRTFAFEDAGTLMTAWGDSGDVVVLDWAKRTLVRRMKMKRRWWTEAACQLPGGRHALAVGGFQSMVMVSLVRPQGQWFWEMRKKDKDHDPALNCIAACPSGQWVAVGGEDSTVRLWPVGDLGLGTPLGGAKGSPRSLAFSPDSRRLTASHPDGTRQTWLRPQDRTAPWQLQPEGDQVAPPPAGAVTAAGAVPSSGPATGAARVTATAPVAAAGRVSASPPATAAVPVASSAPVPSTAPVTAADLQGRWTAVADGPAIEVRWSPDGTALRFQGHAGAVTALAASPDGRRLVSASADGTIRLWDPAGGGQLLSLPHSEKSPAALAFSPDGQCLAASSPDGVSVWSVGPPEGSGTVAN
jgi:WD40 repeat protein